MKQDYSYYFKNNVSVSTSGNYNTRGLKFCIEEIGLERCLYAIGMLLRESAQMPPIDCSRYAIRDSRRGPELVEIGRSA